MKLFKDITSEQFWLTLWTFVITGVVILLCVGTLSAHKEDLIIKDLVEKGHDPLELACLYNQSQYNENACFMLMQGKANKK